MGRLRGSHRHGVGRCIDVVAGAGDEVDDPAREIRRYGDRVGSRVGLSACAERCARYLGPLEAIDEQLTLAMPRREPPDALTTLPSWPSIPGFVIAIVGGATLAFRGRTLCVSGVLESEKRE